MVNPKKARNHAAENARRNEIAKSLGFTSRAHMRRALKQGWSPQRASSSPRARILPPTVAKQPAPPKPRQPYRAPVQAPVKPSTAMRRMRAECQRWSDNHSRKPTSRYDPSLTDKQARAYYDAFINPKTRAWKIENGLDSLRDWLVDEMGYYTDEEVDERYGIDVSI